MWGVVGGGGRFNRFGRLRYMSLSTVPKGTRRNDSGTQMGNYFYFVGAGAVADPGLGHAAPPPLGRHSGYVPRGAV